MFQILHKSSYKFCSDFLKYQDLLFNFCYRFFIYNIQIKKQTNICYTHRLYTVYYNYIPACKSWNHNYTKENYS